MDKESIETEDDREKLKPFKVCFVNKCILGQSNVRIGKPLNLPSTVTSKFYNDTTKEDEFNEDLIKKYDRILNTKGPREKYEKAMTENQKYGWYQIMFSDAFTPGGVLDYRKHTNIIVKEHLMNYAKIR